MVAALRPLGVIFCALVSGAAVTAEVEAYREGQFEVRFRARIAPRAGCDRSMLEGWGYSERMGKGKAVERLCIRREHLCESPCASGSIRNGVICEGWCLEIWGFVGNYSFYNSTSLSRVNHTKL